MAEKIKLSVIADAGAPTGFATVTHNVCRFLQNTGKYDINILGINFNGKPNEWSKEFNIYPANLGGDPLGIAYSAQFIEETKPDVIWLFQDFWNIPYYIGQIGVRPGMVGYYPVDSPNVRGQFLVSLSACVELGTYTHFGRIESARAAEEAWSNIVAQAEESKTNVLTTLTIDLESIHIGGKQVNKSRIVVPGNRLKNLRNPDSFYQIPHGVNTSKFFYIDRDYARQQFAFDKDWFIVGNVNRNQSRKRLDLMIKAFSIFAKDKPNARLVLHCAANDFQGWDLGQLAMYYGIPTKVFFTHRIFEGRIAPIDSLNLLYNTFDVQVNSGGGEGWGLTTFEGAACRVAQIVPDWSATKEIWEGHCPLINVVEVRHEPHTINTAQAIIDVNHLVTLLQQMYDDSIYKDQVAEQCYQVTRNPNYEWEAVGEQFDEIFERAAGKIPELVSIALNAEGQQEIKKAKLMQNQERFKNVAK